MPDAVIGVADHSGWAVLVTVTADGTLLDRRRIELVASDLPKLPHHHEAQKLPLEDALDLIERVRVSAERHAKLALDALAIALSSRILGIAIRECPPLPATIAERLTNYRAQNVADTVIYPMPFPGPVRGKGGPAPWFNRKNFFKRRPTRCSFFMLLLPSSLL